MNASQDLLAALSHYLSLVPKPDPLPAGLSVPGAGIGAALGAATLRSSAVPLPIRKRDGGFEPKLRNHIAITSAITSAIT